MKAMVVGAGRLGSQMAGLLAMAGHDVTAVDQDENRLRSAGLPESVRTLVGDGCEPYVLEAAGVLNADLLIATTWDDEDNLVISLLAKRQYDVGRVVARVNEAENHWLFDSDWGVDVAVPANAPLVSLIEEATGLADTVTLLRLGRAGVNLVETALDENSKCVGHRLGEIPLPAGSVVATVIRDGSPVVPDRSFELRAGDELLIVSETASGDEVHATFQ